MPLKCPVPGCGTRWETGKSQFFRFPTDAALLAKWFKLINRCDINIKTARICSNHFDPTAFHETGNGRRLKKTAIPTVNLVCLNNAQDDRPHYNVCLEKNCGKTFLHSCQLIEHLGDTHKILISRFDLNFNSLCEFLEWKENEEKLNYCQYSTNSRHKSSSVQKIYYSCSRSGQIKLLPETERKHKLKHQGSKKLNYNCTSHIVTRIVENGVVYATYWKEHYGHDTKYEKSIKHLTLSNTSRKEIADDLAAGISPTNILLKKKENFSSSSQITRSDLLTRHDIHNIKKQFHIPSNNDNKIIDENIYNELIIYDDHVDLYEEIVEDENCKNDLQDNLNTIFCNSNKLEKNNLDSVIAQVKTLKDFSETLLINQNEKNLKTIQTTAEL